MFPYHKQENPLTLVSTCIKSLRRAPKMPGQQCMCL